MVALTDKKFNEEQLLLETFSPKMHIERDICKKTNLQIQYRGLKPPSKRAACGGGEWGFNMLFRTSIPNIFHTLTFAGSFCIFPPCA